jgi:peptide/nickel transport system permease protein
MFPASGSLPAFGTAGWLARLFLPALALSVPLAGQLTRVVRTSMAEELDKDYVRTAIGAGVPRAEVIVRNVLRNAMITPVTVLGLRIGYLMGGAVVIEVIFNLPGMGMAILDGVSSNFPTLVQGVTLVVALAFIVINIVVDMLYLLINPRIRSV